MATEIERKFLVSPDVWPWLVAGATSRHIQQGYLAGHAAAGPDGCAVRVRRSGAEAWLNIKTSQPGLARQEFEYPVPLADATEMLATLCPSRVEKVRYAVPYGELLLEVDVFEGANEGLVVAEVELPSAHAAFTPPVELGPEVTHLPRYFNASLAERPYRDWTRAEKECEDGSVLPVPRRARAGM